MGADIDTCRAAIKLVMLVNDVSLRGPDPRRSSAKGFGFFQSKPSSAFSPVAVTPDELGEAWDGGKLSSAARCRSTMAKPFGRANAGADMTFDFPQLDCPCGQDAATLRWRDHRIGHRVQQGAGRRPRQAGRARAVVGYSCIAEIRMIETINSGKPSTPFMRFGDYGPHRDEGWRGPFDFWRDRAIR